MDILFEKSVRIRAKEGLEHCIDVGHVAHMNIVPQQFDSTLIFLPAPPSRFPNNFSMNNLFFIKKIGQLRKSSTNGL